MSLWVFEKVDRIPVQITVENRDYLQLSRFEIGGGKRISRHLSGETVPVHLQNLVSGYATYQDLSRFVL